MSNIILEPCPFCGGPARLVKEGTAYKIFCRMLNCDAQYGWCATKEAAIRGWNSRVTEVIKIPIDKKGRLKHVADIYEVTE